MKLEELPLVPGWDEGDWLQVLGDSFSLRDGGPETGRSWYTKLALSADRVTAEEIKRVEAMHSTSAGEPPGAYADTDLAALIELTDGRWATLHAGNDTSGWGCHGDYVEWRIFDTRGEAIVMGLTNESRDWLRIELP